MGLQRVTGLKVPVLRQCLFVLMHHHCLSYAQSEEGRGKEQTYYQLKTEELLERAEFPAYLGAAKEAFGEKVSEGKAWMRMKEGKGKGREIMDHRCSLHYHHPTLCSRE